MGLFRRRPRPSVEQAWVECWAELDRSVEAAVPPWMAEIVNWFGRDSWAEVLEHLRHRVRDGEAASVRDLWTDMPLEERAHLRGMCDLLRRFGDSWEDFVAFAAASVAAGGDGWRFAVAWDGLEAHVREELARSFHVIRRDQGRAGVA